MRSAILITGRLKSTRLPRKVLKPILGEPMFTHMVRRLKLAKAVDEIVLITSPLEEDMPLYDLALELGIEAYRGHPDDVLQRMYDAAVEHDVDLIVSCTADNPFVDPAAIDRLIDFQTAGGQDYVKMEGLPFGTFSYGIRREALRRVLEIKDEIDTEVWGGYFTETGQFEVGQLRFDDPAVHWPELRLTVDTPADFELIERIFAELHRDGEVFTLEEIIALCRAKPELVAINADVEQKPAKPIRLKPEHRS